MKIYSINRWNNENNVIFKKNSNATKFGTITLITATTLFMVSNATDAFYAENNKKQQTFNIDITASILGITGTLISMIGLAKDEENEENSNRNRC